jgi:hypothetical protein
MEHNNQSSRSRLGEPTGGCALPLHIVPRWAISFTNNNQPGCLAPKEKEHTMKIQSTVTRLLSKPGRFGPALAGLLLLGIAASSSSAQVLPPSSLPYGYSYQEWSAKWWRWTLGQSTNHLELVGYPGVCEGSASRVAFLAGVYIPGSGGISIETNHVTILAGTPLFFPILSVWVDNTGCPTNSFTSLTADELAAEAAGEWSAVTVTTCTIDGVPVAGLDNPTNTSYLVQAPPFSYTTAEHGTVLEDFGEPCIPGGLTVYPAVADGVYLMLSPLSPGRHSIHFVGVVGPVGSPFVEDDITYDITVLRF